MMDDGITLLSSDSEMTSKENKNRRTTFIIQMIIHCLYLKAEDDALFKNRQKKPAFLLSQLNSTIKSEVDILSLQQLACEMDRADLTDD